VLPEELLELLRERFNMPEPRGLSGTALSEYQNKVQRNIRLRVYNLCKTWVSKHWYDFAGDGDLKSAFLEFVHATMQEHIAGAVHLEKILDREMAKGDPEKLFEMRAAGTPGSATAESSSSGSAPKPLLPPHKTRALGLLDFHPTEFARQLTILEFQLYSKIKPWEFLGQAWAKSGAVEKAPHVLDMIQWTNRITSFVATEVLKAKGSKGKIQTILFFIKVLKQLRDLHNFSGISAISAGFQHAAVYRLRPYWGEIPSAKVRLMEEVTALVASEKNFAAFRSHLKLTSLPLIPYMGMYLTDLTFIDDGNPDFVKLPDGIKLISFHKRRAISLVIRDIQSYQQTPFVLLPVKVIQEYIKNAQTFDDDTLYKVSEQTIPRGSNKLTLKELEAKQKAAGASAQEQADSAIASIMEQAEENFNYGELEQIEGYPFYDEDSPANIVLGDSDEDVRGATLSKLVERLTHPKRPSPKFMETFLLTWSSFVEPEQLLELLTYRFNVPQPVKANLDLRTKYKKNVESPTQLRVCNVMKTWVDKYVGDFLGNELLVAVARELMELIAESNPFLKRTAERVVDHLAPLAGGQVPTGKRTVAGSPPVPLTDYEIDVASLTAGAGGGDDADAAAAAAAAADNGDDGAEEQAAKAARKASLAEAARPLQPLAGGNPLDSMHPREAARQLALIEQRRFLESVKPSSVLEYLADDGARADVALCVRSPRVISRWVLGELLRTETVAHRVARLEQFIVALQESVALRNYSAVLGLRDGISHPITGRLEVTWQRCDTALRESFKEIRRGVAEEARSYDAMRQKLKNDGFSTPVVPPLACYISELQGTYRRQPDEIDGADGPLINFAKRNALAQQLAELNRCQKVLYALTPVDAVQSYLGRIDALAGAATDEAIEARFEQIAAQESLKLLEEQQARDSAAQLSKKVRAAMLYDAELNRALVDLGGSLDDVQEELIAQFNADMSLELQAMTAKLATGPDDFEECVNEAIAARFADTDGEITQWSHRDEEGAVYGWADDILLDVLVDNNGTPWILSPLPTLNSAALGSLIRKCALYNRVTGSNARVLAISAHVAPNLKSVADTHNIDVLLARAC
jgi:hypothetical protein